MAEANKTWADWKTAYKRAHSKARVKAQATEGSYKFGAENAVARVHNTSEVETNNGVDEVGMKDLEGYFDNLAAAAVSEKSVLEQLVTNNAMLAATNDELVVIIKKLSNKINNIKRETSRLNKIGVQVKRDLTMCPHCKK